MSYTEDQKAVALAMLEATRGNVSEVSRKCKIPRRTIAHWAKGERVNVDVAKKAHQKKIDLADLMEEEIRTAYGVLGNVREEASYKDLITGMAILTDKMQLLRNKPTEITDATVRDTERVSQLAALLDVARARRSDSDHRGGTEGSKANA